MIYFSYFLVILVLCFFRCKSYEGILLFVMTMAVFALSYPAGNDWIGYFQSYDCNVNFNCDPNAPTFEPGFNILISVLGVGGFIFYNCVIVLFNCLCLYFFSKNFENKAFVYLSMLSFMFWMLYIEAVRQSLAISILLIALPYLYQGRFIKYCGLIFLASTFHITAIICLLFIIPKISKRFAKFSYTVALLFSVSFLAIPFIILNFVYALLNPSSLAYQKLSFYLSSDIYKPQLSAGVGSLFDVIFIMLIISTCLFVIQRNLPEDRKGFDLIFPGVVLFICFAIIIGKMMPVMTRIGWYGIPFIVIILNVYVSDSIYFKRNENLSKHSLKTILVYAFFASQVARPLLYDHSRFGILNQSTIFSESEYLDDKGLMIKAKEKCNILHGMGLTFLCTI